MDKDLIVETAEIPEDIAQRLSRLLIKESIRRQLLTDSVGNQTKYEEAEELLIPVVEEIDKIKNTITEKYVPDDFRSDDYIWSYNGFSIDGNEINIIKRY